MQVKINYIYVENNDGDILPNIFYTKILKVPFRHIKFDTTIFFSILVKVNIRLTINGLFNI